MPPRRVEQRARLRLAAVAVVAVVPADDDLVDRQGGAELLVHRLDDDALLRAAGHVGLVRDDDEAEVALAQAQQRVRGAGHDRHRRRVGGRMRLAVAQHGVVQDAVAVEEDGARHRVDSHFVCATFNFGCDTRRCQITAWKASVCGVTLCAFTVGTMTQASATRAV